MEKETESTRTGKLVQYLQRHESIALDFVISCKPGCYTMIGTELNSTRMIKNGHRENWISGA